MKMNKTEKLCALDRRFLPPKGLLFSIVVQIPFLLWNWPLRPARAAVLTGLGTLIAGIVLNVWAERLFRKNSVGVRPFSPAPSLVSEGPYRFTRNPMYLGLVLMTASVALMTGLNFNLWAAVVLAIWLHLRFVLPEEEFLLRQLGLNYVLYASRTPRWLGLPGPRLAKVDLSSARVDGARGPVAT